MVAIHTRSLPKATTDKLIRIYERLCPDDVLADDDPRREPIAAEMMDIGRAASIEEACKSIAWWHQPDDWTRDFVISVRRSLSRMKFD